MIIIDKTVCKRIVCYRQKRNLTQEELAAKVGLKLNLLVLIEAESRIPRIRELVQLAVGLHVSIDELVGTKE